MNNDETMPPVLVAFAEMTKRCRVLHDRIGGWLADGPVDHAMSHATNPVPHCDYVPTSAVQWRHVADMVRMGDLLERALFAAFTDAQPGEDPTEDVHGVSLCATELRGRSTK